MPSTLGEGLTNKNSNYLLSVYVEDINDILIPYVSGQMHEVCLYLVVTGSPDESIMSLEIKPLLYSVSKVKNEQNNSESILLRST